MHLARHVLRCLLGPESSKNEVRYSNKEIIQKWYMNSTSTFEKEILNFLWEIDADSDRIKKLAIVFQNNHFNASLVESLFCLASKMEKEAK